MNVRKRGYFYDLIDEDELTVSQAWKLLEQGGYGTMSMTGFKKCVSIAGCSERTRTGVE